MSSGVFERTSEYNSMLQRGLSVSGEDRAFFIKGRLTDLRRGLPSGWKPGRILDFGCGTGETSAHLAEMFPDARVTGVDASPECVAHAEQRYGSRQIAFCPLEDLSTQHWYDLCYVNGVFHHIAPARRLATARAIHRALGPDGFLALFENNPWNPGTRLVMSRIEFDRDAIPISPPQARSLLREAGFLQTEPMRFLFFFPRALSLLRSTEPRLARIPFGAQYWLLAKKD
jgi:SAM-dependent methyltransferase